MAVALAIVLSANAPIRAQGRQTPHPAVVRVIAAETGGASLGSGTLVDVNDAHGLVITNWHVVRDAPGSVIVVFPDGFQSTGQVLRMDSNWDLAAILIQKPQVAPVTLARDAPRIGETLTIAGYGSGSYRAAAGPCTQYLAPSLQHPYELVELAASARQGDSGGPIFNNRGELAGVLFGEGGGRTTGAYCGRVHSFLTLAVEQLHAKNGVSLAAAGSQHRQKPQATEYFTASAAQRNGTIPGSGAANTASEHWRAKPFSAGADNWATGQPIVAQRDPSDFAVVSDAKTITSDGPSALPASFYSTAPAQSVSGDATATTLAPIASIAPSLPQDDVSVPHTRGQTNPVAAPADTIDNGRVAADASRSLTWQYFAGDTLLAQLKTVLACMGGAAILFHGMRVLSRTATPSPAASVKRAKK